MEKTPKEDSTKPLMQEIRKIFQQAISKPSILGLMSYDLSLFFRKRYFDLECT